MEIRQQLAHTKVKQVDDIYRHRLKYKLFRLFSELTKYQLQEKKTKQEQSERRVKIDQFITKFEQGSADDASAQASSTQSAPIVTPSVRAARRSDPPL